MREPQGDWRRLRRSCAAEGGGRSPRPRGCLTTPSYHLLHCQRTARRQRRQEVALHSACEAHTSTCAACGTFLEGVGTIVGIVTEQPHIQARKTSRRMRAKLASANVSAAIESWLNVATARDGASVSLPRGHRLSDRWRILSTARAAWPLNLPRPLLPSPLSSFPPCSFCAISFWAHLFRLPSPASFSLGLLYLHVRSPGGGPPSVSGR